jgi:aminocarboxymuconate-semialdehyde decarboxylase
MGTTEVSNPLGAKGVTVARCVVDFFGPDRVLFGTDTPFDAQGGSYFIPRTARDLEGAVDSPADRDAIFQGNVRRIVELDSAVGTLADRAA